MNYSSSIISCSPFLCTNNNPPPITEPPFPKSLPKCPSPDHPIPISISPLRLQSLYIHPLSLRPSPPPRLIPPDSSQRLPPLPLPLRHTPPHNPRPKSPSHNPRPPPPRM